MSRRTCFHNRRGTFQTAFRFAIDSRTLCCCGPIEVVVPVKKGVQTPRTPVRKKMSGQSLRIFDQAQIELKDSMCFITDEKASKQIHQMHAGTRTQLDSRYSY
jgi:hypothetical protein